MNKEQLMKEKSNLINSEKSFIRNNYKKMETSKLQDKIEKYVETQDKNNPDKIMSFALTGTMTMPRTFYESLIESAGHKIAKSVSKKTDYLVIADINSQSSKAKKARELGIKLISPEDLTSILSR